MYFHYDYKIPVINENTAYLYCKKCKRLSKEFDLVEIKTIYKERK